MQTQGSDSLGPRFPTKLVVAFSVLGLVAIAVFGAKATTSQQSFGNTSASQELKEPPTNSWRYTKRTDEMTGEVSQKTACLFSENKLYGDERMQPAELCSSKAGIYPAVFKIGGEFEIVDRITGLLARRRCDIRIRGDDKPVFEVCGNQDPSLDEVNLGDPHGNGLRESDRRDPIMTVLKTAKIIKIELKGPVGAQIFTFKSDRPLDPKW